jgi:protein SCO1
MNLTGWKWACRRHGLARWSLIAAGLALGLAACSSKPAFDNLDLTGNTQFGQNFSLPDTDGHVQTVADFKNKLIVLVFGYTHCPDVCPTTLADLSQALKQLGPDAQRVQVLFVTVDPTRDTPAVMAQYVHAFDPHFIALVPRSDAELQQVTHDFRIYFAKAPGARPGDYTIDHTAASYVFDRDGKLRLFVKDAQGSAPWVHDLKLLLNE